MRPMPNFSRTREATARPKAATSAGDPWSRSIPHARTSGLHSSRPSARCQVKPHSQKPDGKHSGS